VPVIAQHCPHKRFPLWRGIMTPRAVLAPCSQYAEATGVFRGEGPYGAFLAFRPSERRGNADTYKMPYKKLTVR
jgi:hypothetical protein